MNSNNTQTQKHLSPYWSNSFVLLLLFSLALGIRLTYQAEAVVDKPIRADARQYFLIAYNIHFNHVYSSLPPTADNTPPATRINRPPGYPLFLYLFIATTKTIEEFLVRVTVTQAFIGSLTVIMAYTLGRLYLSLPWAFMVGLFTALSPHLVAIDHYLLTESLFTFTIMLATLMLVFAWRRQQPSVTFLSGLLFGVTVLIRPLSLLLAPFMGGVFYLQGEGWGTASRSSFLKNLIYLLIGFTLIYSPFIVYRNLSTDSLSVSSQTIWDKVVIGADINLEHFILNKTDPVRREEASRMWQDKSYALKILKERFQADPFAYLKWYLGGKVLFLWKWDNMYNGDVYQYPMLKKGFHTNQMLKAIHTFMRFLHWPLYVLTLISPLCLIIAWRRRRIDPKTVIILAPLLLFLYFAGLMTLLHPLPRYGIPLRPFSYMLAVYSLEQLSGLMKLKKAPVVEG